MRPCIKDLMKKVVYPGIMVVLSLYCSNALADEIIMNNGDRLSGTVISAKGGKLTFETSYAGNVLVNMDAIKSIETESGVTLRLQGGEVLKGQLKTENGEVQLSPSPERKATIIAWERVRSINIPDTRWDGSVFLGGIHQSGNTDHASLSFGAEATRRSLKDRFNMSFLYNYAEEAGQMTTRDTYGAMKYDYFFTNKFYGLLGIELLNDEFKDLNLRTVVGPGAGYQLLEDEDKALAFEAGAAYFSEDRIDSDDEQWLTARLAANFRYQLTSWLKVTDNLNFYPRLESDGEYTFRNEAALVTSLGASWSLRLSNIWEHDSAPAAGVKQDDFKSSLGLQYSF